MNQSEINIKNISANPKVIQKKDKGKNVSNKNIKISKLEKLFNIFLILIIILLEEFYIFKFFENIKKISKYNNNIFKIKFNTNFNDILPRINLENKTIPSLDEIFNSRELFIPAENLTGDYIRYIRPINETEEEKYKKKYSEKETKISPDIFKRKKGQYDYINFTKLCFEEKLIDSNKIEYDNKPLISIILPSYNKQKNLLKSIRSIQNQSFKNIEIIIINDCSTDNSTKLFEYLLKVEPRVRIFNHLKNMGCWRSRLDGILYSRGKYIIPFDIDDLYEDNYALEDAYNLMEKYNLDSLKFLFRVIRNNTKLNETDINFHVYENSTIIYEPSNIDYFNNLIFKWGNVWNRLTRANIYIKGLNLLKDVVLNYYKNMWDDVWLNTIINRASFSFLVIERVGYIYFQDGLGEGSVKLDTDFRKDKSIKEYLGFLYFDYNMASVKDNKTKIIKQLKKFCKNKSKIKIKYLKSKFYILTNLVEALIEDRYISNKDKVFLNRLLKKGKVLEENINKNKK